MDGWRAPGEGAYGNELRRPGDPGYPGYPGDPRQEHGPWGDPRAWHQPTSIDLSRVQVTRPQRPGSVGAATALMYVGAGLTILSAVAFFATRGQLVDSLAEANPSVSQARIDTAVDRLQSREITRTIVGVCMWVWMAVKNGQGRRWARVVATVLGVINLLALTFVFAVIASTPGGGAGDAELMDYSVPYLILAGVVGVLAVVILVQLYRPDSSRYFEATSRWTAAATLRGY